LSKPFILQAKDRYEVDVRTPLIISDHSEPQPDLFLLDPAVEEYEGGAEARHTLLVVEVADATLRYDRGRKLKAYARAGLPELWIVNLKENTFELYRDRAGDTYRTQTVARSAERVAPQVFPDLEVAVSKIVA
jgi:Uma2 family endonuclease